jgi:hypothetical protein
VADSWVTGGKQTGGIVGYNVGIVQKVTNYGSVSGVEDCVGGVVGNSNRKDYRDNSILKNLLNKGIVSGKNNVGGIAGCAVYVTADSLKNTASIDEFGYVGGIFGGIGSSSRNDVKYLSNSGKINGSHFVGGVSGSCGGNPYINNHSNTSSYSCLENGFQCGSLSKSQNEGLVKGLYYVGGVLGMACS